MKPETSEWIDKAEGDWTVAQREMRTSNPVWNVVSFLAQQCAEKYLKGFLEEQNIAFGRIHDLVVLLNSTGGLLPELDSHRQALAHLGTFGIATRYPGAQADRQAAEDSMKTAESVRTIVRARFQLP
jgi:HEPN domain-containing protein